MIDIVVDKERSLKNLKQIGTPREENKIYIENFAYAKLKEDSYKEKRVFVLMGHTERMEGRYATFVEAVIPVRNIDFVGNTPRWNNSTWGEVFREIKRLYEDMIIVGWAIDIKGMQPKITPELERVHREHFGGVHQILFLLDTIEQEETFYIYKENKVIAKDGFYIYHRARKREDVEAIPITVLQEEAKSGLVQSAEVNLELDIETVEPVQRGRYREMMQEKEVKKAKDNGNLGLAIAVAMLVFVVGVGIYENRGNIFGGSVETNVLPKDSSTESGVHIDGVDATESGILIEDVDTTEVSIEDGWIEEVVLEQNAQNTETAIDIIPVEVISGTKRQE